MGEHMPIPPKVVTDAIGTIIAYLATEPRAKPDEGWWLEADFQHVDGWPVGRWRIDMRRVPPKAEI